MRLLDHFEHWDQSGYPEGDQSYYCLVTTASYDVVRLVEATPWSIRSECGLMDHYWKYGSEMIYHQDHRELRDRDHRVVAWMATSDPMLTPFEMSERLEQQEREIAYLRARVYQLLAEAERDEDERLNR